VRHRGLMSHDVQQPVASDTRFDSLGQSEGLRAEGARPADAARAFAVVMGGPVVLIAAAKLSAVLLLRALVRHERPRRFAVAGVAGTFLYGFVLRRWLTSWG